LAASARWRLDAIASDLRGWAANRQLRRMPVDPRVSYPSYKALDDYIDVERLKALDGFLRAKIAEQLAAGRSHEFDVGGAKVRLLSRRRPGSQVIQLAVKDGHDYFELNDPERWRIGGCADQFGPLMDFLATLPFKATARMVILADPRGRRVTAHRDHSRLDVCHEFLWLRTNLDKRFYLTDLDRRRKLYVESYSAWFDTVNQFHGVDPTGSLTFSIRIDGLFRDDFRAQIPQAECNAACTASLWACLAPPQQPPGRA
jgi:hypothetical protein